MSNSPYKTLGNIRSAVINDAKEASSTGLITQVNRWINEGYEQVILRKKRDWLDKQFTVQMSSSAQAVATVTKHSSTVTFASGTVFPTQNSRDLGFYSTGYSEIYNVSTATSPVVTLSNSYLGGSNTAANGVLFQNAIYLDDSIRSIYQVYTQWTKQPLIEVGPQQFREIQETLGPNLDYPQYCTIFGQNNTTGSRRMLIYPYPNQAYTLYIDANTFITPLAADNDEPIIPMQHRQLLYHFGLYKLFSYHRNDQKASEYLNNFNTMLTKVDGEMRAELDFPQIRVSYPRGKRTTFFPTFDKRLRD